ncbi:MAG TPA: acyl-CoA dehydrogenase family protein [Dehalococcoidia bacterium]|nr:acyl-CoA dehydrogenase family protein [Dehalococcoidia bacterium]
MDGITTSGLLASVANLTPLILAHSDECERSGQLSPEVLRGIADARLFQLWLPQKFGGLETDVATFIRLVEAVSSIDAAAGWLLTVYAAYGRFAGYLREDVAREIYGANADRRVAGSINPSGHALAVDGGYQVSGRWGFGSGIVQSDWVIGNCIVYEGDAPRQGPDGTPEVRIVMLPTHEVEVLDTWDVGGLRGTGSHDYAVGDRFVPEERSFPAFTAPPVQPGTLYSLPLITIFAVSIAAVPLGIARAAIDALKELAQAKTPTGSRSLLKDRPAIQVDMARAEELIRPARAFLFQTVQDLWDQVVAGEAPSMERRALVRLACAQVATSAVQAVDLMYQAAGATANYVSSPLERCVRDVRAAAAHIAVAPSNYELCGRVFLGMDPGTPRF